MDHCTTLGYEIEGILNFPGEIMVDFDRDRDANLSAFELTGGAASNGLTVRDYFAAKVIQGMITQKDWFSNGSEWDSVDAMTKAYADEAYKFADAMMKERAK